MVAIYDTFNHYKNGFLPVGGGILDQPYVLMSCMLILADEEASCEEERKAVEARREEWRKAQGGTRRGR